MERKDSRDVVMGESADRSTIEPNRDPTTAAKAFVGTGAIEQVSSCSANFLPEHINLRKLGRTHLPSERASFWVAVADSRPRHGQ